MMPNFESQMHGSTEGEYLVREAVAMTRLQYVRHSENDWSLPYPSKRVVVHSELEHAANEALIEFHDVWIRFIDPEY